MRTDRRRTGVIVGLAGGAYLAALTWLLATGRTSLYLSADDGAASTSLVAVLVPYAVGLLLIRFVPLRLPAPPALPVDDRLRRQTWGLVGLASVFAVAAGVGLGLAYPLVKVLLLLGAALLVLRRWSAPSPLPSLRAAVPTSVRRFAPVPVLLAWGYLFFYSPLLGTQSLTAYLSIDPVYLVIAMTVTFLTASLLEELFFRVWLQTRLEAVLGRWAGIAVASTLFAVMHANRLQGNLAEGLATIVVFNGGFAVLMGYLWSRYRAVWPLFVAHAATNALPLLPVLLTWVT